MMKLFTFLVSSLALPVMGQSVFLPENGSYERKLDEISAEMHGQGMSYVALRVRSTGARYKLDLKRNEYQVKDWYLQDWYSLQDMFSFDPQEYVRVQGGGSFNEAKRVQFGRFVFDGKKFFHYKTNPAMKEWGGLTHPPIKRLSEPLSFYDRRFTEKDYAKDQSPYFDPEFQEQVDAVSKSELTFGNRVIPLADRAAFEKKKELISKARHTILMSSLVFVCDESTNQVVELLLRRHREGVSVKIIADGFISKLLRHRACLRKMRDAGIAVVETKDFFRHKLKAIYHTKILLTDFTEAIAGGHNMIDADNLSRGTDFMNRDVDLYVKGPMVTDIAMSFVRNWNYQASLRRAGGALTNTEAQLRARLRDERAAGLRGSGHYRSILQSTSGRMSGVCRFINQAPYEDGNTIGKAYLKYLEEVRHHLVITDPVKTDTAVYRMRDAALEDRFDSFKMFNLLHERVQELGRQGLAIDYITTNFNMAGNENVAILDARIKQQLNEGKNLQANWSLAKLHATNAYYGKPHYRNLLRDWLPLRSVRIWNHISFMHSKIFYFDRLVASVGSLNFQHNATDQAYESTAVCMDERLNRELDRILVQDMANSIPLIYSRIQ